MKGHLIGACNRDKSTSCSHEGDSRVPRPCDGLASHPGVAEIFLVASSYRNRDNFRSDGPLGSYADFTMFQCPVSGSRVFQYSEKFMHRIVLCYIHITID